MKNEARFVAGPEGVKDTKLQLVSRLENIKNACGRKYNPEDPRYWSALKLRLSEFSGSELGYLFSQTEGETRRVIQEALSELNKAAPQGQPEEDFSIDHLLNHAERIYGKPGPDIN